MNAEKWRIIREKSEHHKGWLVSTYLNRPFSNVITYFLMDANVTPNQISAFTIIPSLLTFISYYLGNFVLGGILTQIVSIIDGVDGEIARVKNLSSRIGGVIDSVFDRLAEILICLGIGFGSSMVKGNPLAWPFTFIGLTGFLMDTYIAELVKARMNKPLYDAIKGLERKLRFSLSDRGLKMLIICISSILGAPEFGVLIVGVISIIYAFTKFLLWLRILYGGERQ